MENNFEKIEEDLISQFGEPPKSVKRNIDESFSIFRMIGNIIELFMPKVIEVFVNLAGGDKDDSGKNKNKS